MFPTLSASIFVEESLFLPQIQTDAQHEGILFGLVLVFPLTCKFVFFPFSETKFFALFTIIAALATVGYSQTVLLNGGRITYGGSSSGSYLLGTGGGLSGASTLGSARVVGIVQQAAPAYTTVAAAPAYTTVAAAPTYATVAAAPAYATVAAAPATQTVLVQQPAVQTVRVQAVQVQAAQGPINAAIQTQRNVQVVDVPNNDVQPAPQSVVIGPNVQPLSLEFHSQSSPLSVQQLHHPTAPAAPQVSRHEEEADVLRQEIVKPVVQEVHETIQPIRRITQELRPVEEHVNQILNRGEQRAIVQAAPAPATIQVAAAPAAVEVAAAPAAVEVAAAPAVQVAQVAQVARPIQLAVASQPSIAYLQGASAGGYRTVNLGGLQTLNLGGLRTVNLGGLRTVNLGGLRTVRLGGLQTLGRQSYIIQKK